jgi:hypothetical protein
MMASSTNNCANCKHIRFNAPDTYRHWDRNRYRRVICEVFILPYIAQLPVICSKTISVSMKFNNKL